MAFSADQLLEKVNTYLATMPYVREPKGLYAPIEYVLSLGGKRIRPVLMLLSYQLYKENVDDILPQAAGIETYHNYTLLHDDLMDCADMRRNKPTVHKVWDENTAILSGGCHAGVGLSADEQLSGALFEASDGYFQSDCFGNL